MTRAFNAGVFSIPLHTADEGMPPRAGSKESLDPASLSLLYVSLISSSLPSLLPCTFYFFQAHCPKLSLSLEKNKAGPLSNTIFRCGLRTCLNVKDKMINVTEENIEKD